MPETLTWSMIEPRLELGTPWALSMGGTRGVQIAFDPVEQRLYVRLPAESHLELPAAPYAQLTLAKKRDESGHSQLEVSTCARELFREFHRFASLLTETFETRDNSALVAFHSAIRGWQEFVAPRSVLTAEHQIGLLGELLVLEALLRAHGTSGVSAWISRDASIPERHDFRLGDLDLEVKSCRGTSRRHFVHGLGQLIPAQGHGLYVLSLRLEPSGSAPGRTLPIQVNRLRDVLPLESAARQAFDRKLLAALYRDEDAPFYPDSLVLADDPRLIPVNGVFPRITRDMLTAELGLPVATRIDNVSYQVNVDGLGYPQGSPEFIGILGTVAIHTS